MTNLLPANQIPHLSTFHFITTQTVLDIIDPYSKRDICRTDMNPQELGDNFHTGDIRGGPEGPVFFPS